MASQALERMTFPWIFLATKAYAKTYGIFHDVFRINLPGIGLLLRQIKRDFFLTVSGRKLFFDHRLCGCYGRLICGEWNEPETHSFLSKVIPSVCKYLHFINVGANIGEIVIDVARYGNVCNITAFEPNRDCAKAIASSAVANGDLHLSVINKAVTDSVGSVWFSFNEISPLGSGIAFEENRQHVRIDATCLDREFRFPQTESILVIDVEGAEELVLRGGIRFISLNRCFCY